MTGRVKQPLFSVLFSVNRCAPFLDEAVASVLSQSCSDFEFLISANCVAGNDEPDAALLRELEQYRRNDTRISVYKTNVPQLSYCLNLLADKAKGEYLVRMDADDVCAPNRFQVLAEEIRRTSPDIIGSWAIEIDKDGVETGVLCPETTQQRIERRLLFANQFIHPSVAIRRSYFLRMKGYESILGQDYDFWLRAMRDGGSMRNVPEYLLYYRVHDGQGSGAKLGYAAVAGFMLREFCLAPSFVKLLAVIAAIGKVFFRTPRRGVRRRPPASIQH